MTDNQLEYLKKRWTKEARKYVRDLFEEQNWTDEKFDKESLKTVKGLAYWLESFFDIYESACDTPEERNKYSKGIRLIIRELENMEQ